VNQTKIELKPFMLVVRHKICDSIITYGERLIIMMKKRILIVVSLLLVFAFSACSQGKEKDNTGSKSNVSTSAPSSVMSNQTETVSNSDNSTDSKEIEKTYFGQWQIVKELAFGPVSTYSSDEIKNLIGKRLTFSKESATCFGDNVEYLSKIAINPNYRRTVISKKDFEENYGVTFEMLGITRDSIIRIDASDAMENGSTFFIKDNDTLILSGGGVFFELKRVEISSVSSALEAYKAVLQNKKEFTSIDNNKELYLNDFLTNKEIYEITFKATRFTVLDMDGDKVPEVVLELSSNDIPRFYEVLHYMNNTVYGYIFTYRSLGELKADGTFMFSSGAADSGVGKLKFENETYDIDILGKIESNQDDSDLTVSFFIDDKPVTKEEYDAFINKQMEKKDTVWYEFSQENIEKELSVKP